MARSVRGYPPRLLGFAIAISAIGLPIVAGAVVRLLGEPAVTARLLGSAVFFACALVAELKPVSIDIEGKRVVSIAFIFIVSAEVLFGWEYAIAVGVGAICVAMVSSRILGLRLVFNCAVYALGIGAGALVCGLGMNTAAVVAGDPHFGRLTALVFVEGGVFLTVNVVLVCTAMALAEGRQVRPVLVDHVRHSGAAFFTMSAMAALAVSLWAVHPPLLLLLVGPLLTLGLYQRNARTTLVARRAAETDWLTGLGNRFACERAVRAAVEGCTAEAPITLCAVDIDDFKQINDMYGHTAGDEALAEVGKALSAGDGVEAFRPGGDEFLVIVHGDADAAVEFIRGAQAELARSRRANRPAISAEIASAPQNASDEVELQTLADRALYWTKRNGKGRWCVYSPDLVELSWSDDLAVGA